MPDSKIGVKLERVDRILRHGVAPEFAELYHAVRRMRDLARAAGVELRTPVLRVCECFEACEEAMDDADHAIDTFKEEDDGNQEIQG